MGKDYLHGCYGKKYLHGCYGKILPTWMLWEKITYMDAMEKRLPTWMLWEKITYMDAMEKDYQMDAMEKDDLHGCYGKR